MSIEEKKNFSKLAKLLASMARELRTPLHAIIGITTFLEDEDVSDEGRRNLELMRASGGQLLGLVNDLIELSKIESGSVHLENTPVDLEKTVQETVSLFNYKCRLKGLHLDAEINPNIPKYVVLDGGYFRHILINLVNHFVKSTERGSIVIKIDSLLVNTNSVAIQLEVISSKENISQETHEFLFKHFSEIDPSSIEKSGTAGLGLMVCQCICELMNGRMRLESEPGKGSRLLLKLPAVVCESYWIIDEKAIMSHFSGDEDVLMVIIEKFISDVPMQIEFMRKMIGFGNFEDLATVTHTLKGSCSHFFSKSVKIFLIAMERACEERDLELCKGIMGKIEVEIEKMKSELEQLLLSLRRAA